MTLKLAAARNHLDLDGREEAVELIVGAREELHRAVADVRRLVYSLGDPALAALGLNAALRDQVTQLTRTAGLDVTVEIDPLPELSAAVEEATYRIVSEPVTNVVRHAAARRCCVRIFHRGSNLVAEISEWTSTCRSSMASRQPERSCRRTARCRYWWSPCSTTMQECLLLYVPARVRAQRRRDRRTPPGHRQRRKR